MASGGPSVIQPRTNKKMGPDRPQQTIEAKLPMMVSDYINCANHDLVDSLRFRAMLVGEGDDLEFDNGDLTRYGGWVARWQHWLTAVLRRTTSGTCNMPWARSEIEAEYQREMVQLVDDAYYRSRTVGGAVAYKGWRKDNLEELYFMNRWDQWIDGL